MRINEIITESTELEEGWKSKLAGAALAGAAALGGGHTAQAQNQQSYSQPPSASVPAENSSEKMATTLITKIGTIIQQVKKKVNDPATDMKKLTSTVDGFATDTSNMLKKAKAAGEINDEQFNQIKNNLDYLVSLTQSEKKDYKQNQAPSASQSPKAPDAQQSVKMLTGRPLPTPSQPNYILANKIGELSVLMNNPRFRSMISSEQKQIYNDGYSALQSTWGKYGQSDNQNLQSRWKDGQERANRGTLNDFRQRADTADASKSHGVTYRDGLDLWLDNLFGTRSSQLSSGGVRAGANGYK